MNVFTLLALKFKRIELLSSAWRHFEDFFKLFPMVTDFKWFFSVVLSQSSHIGGTFILAKMVDCEALYDVVPGLAVQALRDEFSAP